MNWAFKARDSEDPIDHGNATGTGVLVKRIRSDECALLHCEGIRPSKLLVMNSPANGLATANLLAAFRCQGELPVLHLPIVENTRASLKPNRYSVCVSEGMGKYTDG